jgi:hypothetical protein
VSVTVVKVAGISTKHLSIIGDFNSFHIVISSSPLSMFAVHIEKIAFFVG